MKITIVDKIKHAAMCLVVTALFGWHEGVKLGVVIELIQAEHGHASPKKFIEKLLTWDTFFDLLADVAGIGLGLFVRRLVGN